jgi:hypothetical protein
MSLNQASSKSGITNALKEYASYEQGAQQIITIPESGEEMPPQESYGSGSQMPMIPPPMDSSNPFEFLEYQG